VLKNYFFAGILKVNDENSRIRIQDPNPDPLVRGMDPRIRIRIHPKILWIRNTAVIYKLLQKEYKKTMPVNEKIPYYLANSTSTLLSIFMSIFSKKYNLLYFVVCNGAQNHGFLVEKNIDFWGGGGDKYSFSMKI
jgi:hypothetical protein